LKATVKVAFFMNFNYFRAFNKIIRSFMKKTTYCTIILLLLTFGTRAQFVSGYSFSESEEVYSQVSGTVSSATDDDGAQNGVPIGFDFPFGGQTYTTFSISVNGFIRLGADIGNENWVNSLDNDAAQKPLIAPFWDDHNLGTGSIDYLLSGVSPDQTLEISWNHINPSGGGGTSDTSFGSFKLRLHENGVIDFIYADAIDAVGDFSASIGLNDTSSYLSITPSSEGAMASYYEANNNVNSTAALLGKKYTFTPVPACSGAPAPGNTIASPASVCLGYEVLLTLENPPGAYGLSYQWQSSTDGENFTDIDGAQSNSLSISQQSATYYQCVVSCGADSTTSTAVLVEMNAPQNCYCMPTYDYGKTDGDLISNVVIPGTTLSNDTGTDPVNPSYTYFTGEPNYTAELQAGVTYAINVTIGSYGQQNQSVWIDYNDDTYFTADEKIGYSTAALNGFDTSTFNIQLSCDAPPGTHRLRIRDAWATNSYQMDACANYGYGETEDYDITIIGGSDCPSPSLVHFGSYNSSSAQILWSPGCNQTSWQVAVVPSGDSVGEPQYENVTSPFVASGLEASTAYDFYVRANCGENSTSDWAGPFTLTTLELGVANDDCGIAYPLQVGNAFNDYAITATNVGATKTLGEPNVTCATFGFGGDVWFSTVVPDDGNVTIETQLDPGSAVTDTGLAAYSGTCGSLTNLGCSDDDGVLGMEGFSRLSLTGLTPGETIYARVWEYANDSFGTFRVSSYDTTLGLSSQQLSGLKVYPNPVTDFLTVSYRETIKDIEVFNLLGQQLIRKETNATESRLDMSALPSGNYLVKVQVGDRTETIKVIKQ
jgi:hypothetical protein